MLTRFLLQQWSRDNSADQIANHNIYFSVEDKCFQLFVNDGKVVCEEITELNRNHKEADTQGAFHLLELAGWTAPSINGMREF